MLPKFDSQCFSMIEGTCSLILGQQLLYEMWFVDTRPLLSLSACRQGLEVGVSRRAFPFQGSRCLACPSQLGKVTANGCLSVAAEFDYSCTNAALKSRCRQHCAPVVAAYMLVVSTCRVVDNDLVSRPEYKNFSLFCPSLRTCCYAKEITW